MKKLRSEFVPKARSKGLIIEEMGEELLIYDLERHKAHCLNPTAARVWKRCDGQTAVKDITRSLARQIEVAIDEEIVWFALERLSKARLLGERVRPVSGKSGMSRRGLIKKMGVAAAISLPAITTILAPTAQAAISCAPNAQGCTGLFGSCSTNLACCSCKCVGGSCQP